MKKTIQCFISLVIIGLTAIAALAVAAGQVPNPMVVMPNAYNTAFPSVQLNQNFSYVLGYTDSAVAILAPQSWQVITASQVASAGNNLAVNTAAAAITVTLPSPTNSSPLNAINLIDATNTFNSHALTVAASGIANINSLSGASAVYSSSTQGALVRCVYLNSVIGYNCGAH